MKKFLLDIETNVAAVILLLAFLVVGIGIVARDFLDQPLLWTEEISRFFLIYIVFLAGSGAIAAKTHFRVEFLELALPPRLSSALFLIFDIVIIGLLLFLIYGGWNQVVRDHMVPTLVLQWPSSVSTFALPLAAVFMTARMVVEAIRHFRIVVGAIPASEDSTGDSDPAASVRGN